MSLGAGKIHLRTLIDTITSFVKSKANQVCASTCDGPILRMHYRWTFFALLGGFFTVWYSWYHNTVITCVSHFNAETQVRLDYINICLSYPYVENANKKRRYLLFYRWISWSLLLLAGIYYIPRKVSKNLDNTRCKKLVEDLAANAFRYDQSEKQLVEAASRYLVFNLRTHNGLYWKYLGVNVLALFIDIFVLQFLDFILQGRFIQYGIKSFPFHRDPQNFTDYMSQTFPPFALCELAAENQLVNKRTEIFGCHLTIMELYEKLFLGLWVWLIILTFLTCLYIVFLVFMWFPCVRLYLLRAAKPSHATNRVRNTIPSVIEHCKIGDVYLLYRLKQHLSHARFYELMTRLADPNLFAKQSPPTVLVTQPEQKMMMPNNGVAPHMNQLPSAPQNPQMHPPGNLEQPPLARPEMIARHPGHPDQWASTIKRNVSPLID